MPTRPLSQATNVFVGLPYGEKPEVKGGYIHMPVNAAA